MYRLAADLREDIVTDSEWYFCLTHHAVEPYEGCKSEERLGPYATHADAAAALEKVHQRNEAWENDPRFNDDAEKPEDARHDDADWSPFSG
jgi:hypothetical protein